MPYQNLLSYQQATIIYDFTVEFCQLYIPKNSRTIDQMVQAARSGKQNIVEGCRFSRVSNKMEIKLIGVARASLEELLEDYRDFLRQRNLKMWDKDSVEASEIRGLRDRSDRTYRSYMTKPETAANAMICLINQTNYLLDRQINSLEKKFIEEGGYSEKLFKKRGAYRSRDL
jgi:restriction system protein